MPYENSTSLIAPYLRPFYPAAIEGIKDARTQGRWEQVQEEEKRKWEANRPFVDAQAKQMQFAANKSEEVNKIWNNLHGGQGYDPAIASAGIDPKEFTRAYLGMHAQNPKIKVELPGVGQTEVDANSYLTYLTHQKPKGETVPVNFQGRTINVPAEQAYHFNQKPEKNEQMVDVPGYGRIPASVAYHYMPDLAKKKEGAGYTQAQMLDDNRSHYGFLAKNLMDPVTGMVRAGSENDYSNLVNLYQADQQKIAANQKPSWYGGTTPEQDKDQAFLNQIRMALGGGQPPAGTAPQTGTRQFQVNPNIDPSRPAINNPDGSFSTERTISIEIDGKYYLIPTIVDGKQLTPDQAIMATMTGKNAPVGEFNSKVEADVAAKLRSSQIGNMRPNGQ